MNECLFCGKPASVSYCSLSCSNKARRAKNEKQYYLSPKRCLQCDGPVPYQSRHINRYCSSSCSAAQNNRLFPKRKRTSARHTKAKLNWYDQNLPLFREGKLFQRPAIRRCLLALQGNKCAICSLLGFWNGAPMTLIVDHIDGNAGNNLPENLRLLCPNCNSQTPTFCGRNLGKGRQSLGLSKN